MRPPVFYAVMVVALFISGCTETPAATNEVEPQVDVTTTLRLMPDEVGVRFVYTAGEAGKVAINSSIEFDVGFREPRSEGDESPHSNGTIWESIVYGALYNDMFFDSFLFSSGSPITHQQRVVFGGPDGRHDFEYFMGEQVDQTDTPPSFSSRTAPYIAVSLEPGDELEFMFLITNFTGLSLSGNTSVILENLPAGTIEIIPLEAKSHGQFYEPMEWKPGDAAITVDPFLVEAHASTSQGFARTPTTSNYTLLTLTPWALGTFGVDYRYKAPNSEPLEFSAHGTYDDPDITVECTSGCEQFAKQAAPRTLLGGNFALGPPGMWEFDIAESVCYSVDRQCIGHVEIIELEPQENRSETWTID